MANKLSVGLAVSLLLSGSFSGLAYADGGMSALEKQIMNGDAAPSAGNPDNFPWMNKDGSAKQGVTSESAPPTATSSTPPAATSSTPPAATSSAPPPPPIRESVTPKPPEEKTEPPAAKQEWPHVTRPEEKLKVEHAEAAPQHAKAAEARPSAERTERGGERPAERQAETTTAKKTNMLFGRIEQLSAGAGASFPSLKAQTPMMDPRGALAGKVTATTPVIAGVVKSFPGTYEGIWGGRLVLQQIQIDPNYYRIDAEEARRKLQAMKPGLVGDVNFNFERSRGAISLEPAKCLFMVPIGDTNQSGQVQQMLGGSNSGPLGGVMNQMMAGMKVPIVLFLGDFQQSSAIERGVSGNRQSGRVIKNEVRQLAPNVLEQQIVTQETTWDKRTNIPRTGYGESVIRFTRQSPTVFYVNCATVNYGANKQFLEKMVFYGSVGKGVVMNTDPMQQAMQGVPGGGAGGLGALQGMFGGGGSGQTPTMPAGGLDGMLKNLFGGQ